jgi:hypothetical protein
VYQSALHTPGFDVLLCELLNEVHVTSFTSPESFELGNYRETLE